MNILKNYKFSIIIPNFNGGKFIEGSLKSILNQKYKNYEIIIVDGKSTDNSHTIINNYTGNNIKWINKIDRGISNGFNIGIKESSGDFILFLGSDDYLYNGILCKVNSYINNITHYGLIKNKEMNVFCDSINYWSEKNLFEKRRFPTKIINKTNLIRYGTLIGLQNIYFNKKWILDNKLDENNIYSMDYEIYFRMIEDYQKFIYIPEINSINYNGNNISCKFAFQSGKEAINIGFKYSRKISDYFYLYKRLFFIHLFKFIKKY